MDIGKIFVAGGIVMYPLSAFSIVAAALASERIKFWWSIKHKQKRLVRDVLNIYISDRQTALVRLRNNLHFPIARIFLAAMELEYPNPEEFRLALESEAQAEVPILKRFNTAFETIISLAPLLGLLGTVLGLITSFATLSLGDVGGSRTTNVTAGISEALVSTAAGLVVAIFTLFFANTFRGFYQQEIALIQEYGGQLELLYRRYYYEPEHRLQKEDYATP